MCCSYGKQYIILLCAYMHCSILYKLSWASETESWSNGVKIFGPVGNLRLRK